MVALVDRILLWLASKRSASFAIYFGMIHYACLWIFPQYQMQLLAFGLFVYAFRVPYFIRIGERAFVAQSVFFFCVEFVALFLSVESQGLALRECYALF